MRKTLFVISFLAICSLSEKSPAHSTSTGADDLKTTSLCALQKQVAKGKHETVQVSGVFAEGSEGRVLEDAKCPDEATWVELELRSHENKKKLYKLLDHSNRANVVVEGEFYGPPLPDPKLPEAIKKAYHPGWGHLAAFKTKLVVHAIRDVEAAPTPTTR